jgi:ornithine cyclodeaminase
LARLISLDQIKSVLGAIDVSKFIEEGFIAYSAGRVVVPPVGELIFEEPPGDAHIKYGYIRGDDYFVIKIASGFYENYRLDLPSGSGLMLLFSQRTGQPLCILLDEGYLTDVRTAVAGQIAAKYLAPKSLSCIGVFGAGIQARMQVEYLESVTPCRNLLVWGRPGSAEKLEAYRRHMEPRGYTVRTTHDAAEVGERCRLIITATPAKAPLLRASQVRKGTHITAMGSDTPEKQELDPAILQMADIVVADSIEQCLSRGEIHKALQAGQLHREKIRELGRVIADTSLQRTSDDQITVADLTGVAVQDIQIAKAVFQALEERRLAS